MDNRDISDILNDATRVMELHGVNDFKVKSLRNAAFQISRTGTPLVSLSLPELEALKGVGKSTASKIAEIISTGKLKEAEELILSTPPGVIEIMDIKGVGPKKTAVIWKELQIESPGELLYACNENRLVELKGFGTKTQELIKNAIEFKISNTGLFHYAALEALAVNLVASIAKMPIVEHVSLTGEIRRKCEVVSEISVLIATTDSDSVIESVQSLALFIGAQFTTGANELKIINTEGVKFAFIFTSAEKFASDLLLTTGNEAHLEQSGLRNHLTGNSGVRYSDEAAIYTSAGMPFFEPETREGRGEVELARSGSFPELIQYSDLKGCLHNHSTYSDGLNTLREMAEACMSRGYEYFGICDHSGSAFYANGMQPDRVRQQHQEIDILNKELSPFRIFKGIESDILNDGSLDYEDSVLASFDFVVASVHSNLKMDEAKATARLIKAVSNPFTSILGHPTGRLLLARKGYPINHKEVIDACAYFGVAIELNAHPFRLDLDWRWISYAVGKNVMISINPDAHQINGISDMYFGTCVARKGLLPKSFTLNALGINEIEKWFKDKQIRNL